MCLLLATSQRAMTSLRCVCDGPRCDACPLCGCPRVRELCATRHISRSAQRQPMDVEVPTHRESVVPCFSRVAGETRPVKAT